LQPDFLVFGRIPFKTPIAPQFQTLAGRRMQFSTPIRNRHYAVISDAVIVLLPVSFLP